MESSHIIVYRFLLSLREFYQTPFYLIDLTSWPTEGHLGFFYTVLQWKSLYRSNLCLTSVQFSSVAQLCPTLCDPMNHSTPSLPVHHQLSEFTQIQVQWVSDAIQPSHPLSSPQSFPASGSFQMSQLFASCGQSIRVSASASVLPMNIQDWSPLGWTGWISLQSKGLSRVFSNIIVQKHQFFSAHLSL